MRSFFKIFFASLLALIVFCFIVFFFMFAIAGAIASGDKPEIAAKSVLVIDLSQSYPEKAVEDPVAVLRGEEDIPGLSDVVRLIAHAKSNNNISGIYIKADGNANGFAASNELRNALIDFRNAKKFVLAHGDMMSQGAYFVATAADKVYVNPAGAFDWSGFQVTMPFVKGMLDKLDIRAQIFYAGKFKSATEIFRVEEMTPENELQTMEWLGDIYRYFLAQAARARGIDTASLHRMAMEASIRTPQDAVNNKLIDGLRYDDEVKAEIRKRIGAGKNDRLHFISLEKYDEAVYLKKSGSSRIAVIYAQGDIVDGQGTVSNIGGDRFRALIRKARMDGSVKAIVLRVNSGGGSALASENIWRELQLAKEEGKPVVVSFGDVAASGGYYIACGADSIFAAPNTITGSIGVFGVLPDMQGFFKNKLGITFDGVKTAPYADAGGVHRPLTEAEGRMLQQDIDRIYLQFKQRVAAGRKMSLEYVDSIAQGRVWSGEDAIRNGLVDRIGSLQDAVNSAARLAKLDSWGLREYPESKSWIQQLLNKDREDPAAHIRSQIGAENYRIYQQLVRIREMSGSVQARLPFEFYIH